MPGQPDHTDRQSKEEKDFINKAEQVILGQTDVKILAEFINDIKRNGDMDKVESLLAQDGWTIHKDGQGKPQALIFHLKTSLADDLKAHGFNPPMDLSLANTRSGWIDLDPNYVAPPEQKILLLAKVISKLDGLKFFVQLAWESKLINNEKYIELSVKLEEIGRMLGGWKRGLQSSPTKPIPKKTLTTE